MLSVDRVLQLFDLFAEEFVDLAGVESHHVIVVRTAVQFEDGVATFEIVALDKARGLELRQHPLDRCQSDVFIEVEQTPVDVLGGQITSTKERKSGVEGKRVYVRVALGGRCTIKNKNKT